MNPCCGVSLQTGTKIVAILQLVFSILGVVLGILALSAVGSLASDTQNVEDRQTLAAFFLFLMSATVVSIVGVFLIVVGSLFILLSALLLSGAIKRNQTMCMIWFVLQTIFLVMSLVGDFWVIFSEGHNDPATIGLSFFGILIDSYSLWVVWSFMSEIRDGVERKFKVPKKKRRRSQDACVNDA